MCACCCVVVRGVECVHRLVVVCCGCVRLLRRGIRGWRSVLVRNRVACWWVLSVLVYGGVCWCVLLWVGVCACVIVCCVGRRLCVVVGGVVLLLLWWW